MSRPKKAGRAASTKKSSVDSGSLVPSGSLAPSGSMVSTRSGVSAELVRARTAALTSALESGAGCLPAVDVNRAQSVIVKATARISIAGGRTVVALAGATGSGKSSLFNDLIGVDVAVIGARRPTTSTPTAAIWGSEPASVLLDWLKVWASHLVDEKSAGAKGSGPGSGLELDGLVLLDLPDFDSVEVTHRLEVDRVLELVDVFIWVTDPQKYADALLHEDYIARLSAHDAVTIVVLNQADRLTPETLAACRKDLLRLLGADGVVDAEVIVTSAKDGSGVVDLRHRISLAVAAQNAAVRRLDSDLRSTATALRSGVADSEPRLNDTVDANLVDALSRAAGIPIILDAVERDYRRETWARTGWPFTRWAGALRPAPHKLLRVNRGPSGASRGFDGVSELDVRSVLGRSSLPPATPAARSAVELATRGLGDMAGEGLPQAWADAVSDAAAPPGEDLADTLDQTILATSLRAGNPVWWAVFGLLQWVFAIAAVAGVIWLGVPIVLGWLQLPAIAPPRLGVLPVPFLLFVGGLLMGYSLSLLARTMGRVGGRRRKVLVAARIGDSVSQVVRDRLVAPVQDVLDRHRATRERLEVARKRG